MIKLIQWIIGANLVFVALVMGPACTTTGGTDIEGTVLDKMERETEAIVLEGRVLARMVMNTYAVVIQLSEPLSDEDDGDTLVYVAFCSKHTWDGLEPGETYKFTVIDSEVREYELISEK